MNKKTGVNNKNYCDLCKKTIRGSSYKFKSHLFHEHKSVSAKFKCNYCLKEYFRLDMYKRHIDKHIGASKRRSFTCDHCYREFAVKNNLIRHLKIHDDTPFMKYRCMACGITYCEERLLKYHIRKTHYNLKGKETPLQTKELNETWIERVKETEVCVEMTKVNNNMICIKKLDDIKNKDVKKEKSDTDDRRDFKQYINSVFAHQDHSQYSKATCDYCKKEMLKKSLLSHIRERHLKLKRFKCDECEARFSRHYMLVDHVCRKIMNRRRK